MPDVIVKNGAGVRFEVPQEHADELLETGNYSLEPDSERIVRQAQAARLSSKRTIGDKVETGLRAFARFPSFGLIDMIGDPAEIRLQREANPTIDTIGSVAGLGVGVLSGAGALTGAKAAAGGAAGLATRASTGLGAKATSFLGGGKIAKGVGFAATGAAEGAAYETASIINDSIINQDPVSGDAIKARLKSATIIGGGANLALGGVGAAARRLLTKPSKVLAISDDMFVSPIDDMLNEANGAVLKAVERKVMSRVDDIVRSVDPDLPALVRKNPFMKIEPRGLVVREAAEAPLNAPIVTPADDIGSGVLRRVGSGTEFDPGLARRVAGEVPPKVRRVGSGTEFDAGLGARVDDAQAAAQREVRNAAADSAFSGTAREGVGVRPKGRVVQAGPPVRTYRNVVEIINEVRPAILKEHQAAYKAVVKAAKPLQGMRFDKLARMASKSVKGSVSKVDEFAKALQDLDNTTGSDLLAQFQGHPGFGAMPRLNSSQFSDIVDVPQAKTPLGQMVANGWASAVAAKKAMAKGAVAAQGKVVQGLKKAGVGYVGALSAKALGLPLGTAALAGRLLPGRVGLVAAAAAARAQGAVRSSLQKSVKVFVGSKPRPRARLFTTTILSNTKLGVSLPEDKGKDPFERRVSELNRTLASPRLQDDIDEQLFGLAQHGPQTASLVSDGMIQRLQYYQQALPSTAQDSALRKPYTKVSDEAKGRFARTVFAGEDPTAAMDKMLGEARVDLVMKDTVKALYPTLWNEYQLQTLDAVAEDGRPLPYAKRLFLTRLYDVDIEPSNSTQFIVALQQAYAVRKQEQAPEQIEGVPTKEQPTTSQRLEAKT